MSRLAILRIDAELLVAALRLPADVRVEAARMSFERPGVVELRIAHDSLRELVPGDTLPDVHASFQSGAIASAVYVPHFTRFVEC